MTRSLMGRLETGDLEPGSFGHREHLQAAWEVLGDGPFLEAATRYARAIERFARQAGAADKYHLTVTLAYLSLIAERMAAADHASFDAFLAANPDLEGNALAPYYSPERLSTEVARRVFLLPDSRGISMRLR